MIITAKALEHYKIWFDKYYNDYWTYYQSKPTILNALIIEWFGSVGIYISINYVDFYDELRNNTGFETYVTNKGLSVKFRVVSNRQEAIKQAIKKANEIYNENIAYRNKQ